MGKRSFYDMFIEGTIFVNLNDLNGMNSDFFQKFNDLLKEKLGLFISPSFMLYDKTGMYLYFDTERKTIEVDAAYQLYDKVSNFHKNIQIGFDDFIWNLQELPELKIRNNVINNTTTPTFNEFTMSYDVGKFSYKLV